MPRKLWWIFLLAVAVRGLFAFIIYAQSDGSFLTPFHGFDGYYEISQNLLAGNGFSPLTTPPFLPDAERTPLYPLFMATLVSVFRSYYAVLIAQILLGGLIPLLAYRIALQMFTNERIATIVALILALEPLTIYLSTILVSETLFTVLFLASVTLFFDYLKEPRGRLLAYATGLLALATLARPTTEYLPLLFLLAICWTLRREWRRAVRHSLVVSVVFLLLLSPWLVHNLLFLHRAVLTTQQETIFSAYFIPSVIALEEHRSFDDTRQHPDTENENGTIAFFAAHPVGVLQSIGMTAFSFFTHDGYADILGRLGYASTPRLERPLFLQFVDSPRKTVAAVSPLLASPAFFVIVGRIFWVLISLCFFYGTVHYLRTQKDRARGIIALLVIFYFVLTTAIVGFGVNARYRVPVNAFILTFAVYGLYDFLYRLKNRQKTLNLFRKGQRAPGQPNRQQ